MQTKIIKFRPLRRHKKSGKIIVASYMSWNKIRSADYWQKFELVVDNEYRELPRHERVYNHKLEDLWFFKYKPEDIKTYPSVAAPEGANYGTPYIIDYGDGQHYMCMGIGLDAAGTPCLSHYTTNQLANDNYNLEMVEPLTVGAVIDWYVWFLFNLNNVNASVKTM